MDISSIDELAAEQLAKAVSAESGRSSVTVYSRPGARLRQTLMAPAAGRVMGEHKSPGDASLLCVRGRRSVTTSKPWNRLSYCSRSHFTDTRPR